MRRLEKASSFVIILPLETSEWIVSESLLKSGVLLFKLKARFKYAVPG